jgi:hypothetical protein
VVVLCPFELVPSDAKGMPICASSPRLLAGIDFCSSCAVMTCCGPQLRSRVGSIGRANAGGPVGVCLRVHAGERVICGVVRQYIACLAAALLLVRDVS